MIVLDTCAILWDALKPEELSKKAKEQIEQANEGKGLYFCDISLWEIAMLIKKKRLDPGVDYSEFIDLLLASNRYILSRITPEIAEISTQLPKSVNQDPADRIIAATSIANAVPLVTADLNLRRSKHIQTIW